jgi:hypothetical protein
MDDDLGYLLEDGQICMYIADLEVADEMKIDIMWQLVRTLRVLDEEVFLDVEFVEKLGLSLMFKEMRVL